MSAGYMAERVAAIIEEHGETMVLSRPAEGTTIELKGKRLPGNTEELGNSSVQSVFRVKLGAAKLAESTWATKAPKRGDTLMVDGRPRRVRDSFPLKDGDVVALYEIEVAG